jgi:hypothetical protein
VIVVDFPTDPSRLTAEWLTLALRASHTIDVARVTALEIAPMGIEKGITGSLVRLVVAYDIADPRAPRSLVAKFSSPDPGTRAVVHSMGFYAREVHFYRNLAAVTPIRTPRCYFADVDPDEGWSLLLLEDVVTRNGSWVAGSSVADVELAVGEIAEVHAAWWERPALQEPSVLDLTGFLAVDQQAAVAESTWTKFLDRLTVPHSAEILAVGKLFGPYLGRVAAYLYEAPPRTLVHDDFDADNLFFPLAGEDSSLTVLDWQLTTAGHAPVDVAWVIAGQCEPTVRRAIEARLVRDFHARLVERGVRGYPFGQCWDDYRLALLLPAARIASAIGSQPDPFVIEGGFWNVVFPRYAQAIHDLRVGELLEARFPASVFR